MGRNHRKEDRQARKKTKTGIEHIRGTANKGSSSGFAPPIFGKGQFASLTSKGKARQQQQQQNGDDEIQDNLSYSGRVSSATLEKNGIYGVGDQDDMEPANFAELDSFTAKSHLAATVTGRKDSSIKAYMKELRKVMEHADVLLEVLDARDPLGCRSLETERLLMREGKKVVLILNKIDLVPKSNVEAWLKYLRHDFPTLAFKASTQSQRSHLSQGASAFHADKKAATGKDAISSGAEAIGAGALLMLIKNYSRNLNLKTSITIGIFGAPNVGKSSLINSLKRARVCSVASTPGHTKVVQGVMLDKSVRLLDCPGIVFSDESGGNTLGLSEEEIRMRKHSALLRNVVKVELVEDPITPVEAIMARVDDEKLAQVYNLEYFQTGNAQDFLMRIAVQRGRIGRGGKLDLDGTARSVLHDWNVGKIKYYTQPPALHRSAILSGQSTTDGVVDTAKEQQLAESSAILSGFSEAFDLAGLFGEADAEVFGTREGKAVPEPPRPRYAADEAEEEVEEMQDDHAAAPVQEEETDISHALTLGKRQRNMDDSDSEDDDAFSSRIPDLATMDDDDLPAAPSTEFTFHSPVAATPSWGDKKTSSKRTEELSTVFSSHELENLAKSRSMQRRKLKKLKKRAERSGAGLVGMLEASMDFVSGPGGGTGVSGSVQKRKSEAVRGNGGIFAALMEEDDEEEERERMVREEEVKMATQSAVEDIEEEL